MRRRFLPIAGSLLLVALWPVTVAAQDPSPSPDAAPSYLYAISGSAGSVEGMTLTLHGVPSVTWFTDRPVRDAGHMGVGAFLEGWDQGTDSFAADPPNADLSILGEGDEPIETVVELLSVSGDATDLTFEVAVLEGTLPEGALGPAVLFIDICDAEQSVLCGCGGRSCQ